MGNVFETKAEMPKETREYGYGPVSAVGSEYKTPSCFPAGASVGVDMTCDQRRNLNMSNYPRYDALDVQNVIRPRFGHGY